MTNGSGLRRYCRVSRETLAVEVRTIGCLLKPFYGVARTGCPWRDLPVEFGAWNSIYVRFARWSDKQVWQKVFSVLREDADFEEVFLDSTIARAHQHAAGAAKKKVRRRLDVLGVCSRADCG